MCAAGTVLSALSAISLVGRLASAGLRSAGAERPIGRQVPPCARRLRGITASAASDTVGVIGGGIAGITAARVLADAGVPVVIHERAESVGGRLSPTACSYIKAKDPAFAQAVEQWERDGVLAEWRDAAPHLITTPGAWEPLPGEERWFVAGKEASPTKLTDVDLTKISVKRGEVFDVNLADRGTWVVATEQAGDADDLLSGTVDADAEVPIASHIHSSLIVATPVADAANFVERKILDGALGRRRYKDFVKERVSVALVFEKSLELPFNFAAMIYADAPVTVAICDSSRRAAAGVEAPADGSERWVLQSATGWASGALDDELEPQAMRDALLDAFATALGGARLPPVRESETVLWPYGDMDYELEGGCAWDDELSLALAGDWAFNGRVEGAWLSGRAAAERVLEHRNPRACADKKSNP